MNSTTPNATQQVLAADESNVPPAPDHQFFMISITATYTGSDTTNPLDIDVQLKAIGISNRIYTTGVDDTCGVTPAPDWEQVTIVGGDVASGGSVTGNICFSVLSSDAASLELYNDQDVPVWFALH